MDEATILATIGKFYLEVSRLQQIAENQQQRIIELETQLSVSTVNNNKQSDKLEKNK
jgi:hypothetical protein